LIGIPALLREAVCEPTKALLFPKLRA